MPAGIACSPAAEGSVSGRESVSSCWVTGKGLCPGYWAGGRGTAGLKFCWTEVLTD